MSKKRINGIRVKPINKYIKLHQYGELPDGTIIAPVEMLNTEQCTTCYLHQYMTLCNMSKCCEGNRKDRAEVYFVKVGNLS